ncbi:MAG TPA: DUF222 domain-containing protein [Polyangia bacterium]|jgi:hypothetical protein|nr:DUF222 domain-containing protein [Polyangia bacterium]
MNATTATTDICLADEIAVLAAQVDVGTHRLLTCIRRFDESEEWGHQGARTCADWLAWRIGLAPGAAREKVRVARALGRFPAIDAAMASGRLSYAKVRALTRVATPTNEARLVEIALAATGAQLERMCRRFRRVIDDGAIPGMEAAVDPSCDPRGVHVRNTDAGHVRIDVTLDPADAALVLAAIDRARDQLRAVTTTTTRASTEARSRNREPMVANRLDGLIAMAERTMAPAPQTDGADARLAPAPQVIIHLDQAVLGPDGARDAYLDDGTRVSAETFRRVSCDSALVAVTTGKSGEILDVGRKTRVVPTPIRRALWSRDRGCRFPMCTNRRFVDAHHVRHWSRGGPTSFDNLVLLCSFHHRLLHEGGFKVSMAAGDIPRFLTPRGQEIVRVPDVPSIPIPTSPTIADPGINLCDWDGEPVDYDEAVDAMCAASA